ncbi:MAG: haloacid dehalogenase type II, partial [Desulfobulbia bacterium]
MSYKAYVFDAYGTLFDVHSAAARLKEEIGPDSDRLSQIWRDKQLQYTWIRALTGKHQNFEAVTAAALDFAISSVGGIDTNVRQKLLEAYMELDSYPEVRDILSELKTRGAHTAILSNGTAGMLDAAVTSSGIADLLDACISIEEAGIYKPAPEVYQLAVERISIGVSDISFQSSNRWDIAGAKSFGFHTAWINRFGQPDEFPD